MMIHLTRRQHAGVDIIVKAVSNKMFVPEKLGAVVKKVRMDCSRCKIILKKTSELQMAEHPESRTDSNSSILSHHDGYI